MPKSNRKRRSTSKSGYFGVKKNTTGNKYQARVSIGGGKKRIIGSSYNTAKQAAKAYDKEVIKLRRPFSSLNYPKRAPAGYAPIQKPLQSRNTVGYRGVCKTSKGEKFQSYTDIAGKRTYHGRYDTAKEAAIFYDRAVLKANRSTSLLNFPDMVHNLDVEPKRKKQKLASTNTTGYRGVSKGKKNTFRARISIGNSQQKLIGTFDTAIQAALAYDQAAIKAGKIKSTLNFPDVEPKRKKCKPGTGYKGVYHQRNGRFVVQISSGNGKQHHVGSFGTAIEGAIAYDQAAINAGKQNVVLNFPEGLPVKVKRKMTVSQKVAFGYRV